MDRAINGYYKLSWRERIGFCSGDLAQNLIYQTVSIWLLFYYNNVYGLGSAVVSVMFLVVRIIDVLWDPMVGAFVDKSHPRWGKYRSWLIVGGIPLAAFAMLCFWNGFSTHDHRAPHHRRGVCGKCEVCEGEIRQVEQMLNLSILFSK